MTGSNRNEPRIVDPLAPLLEGRARKAGARLDPLAKTALEVEIRRGLATVTTTRTFRNGERRPIEALLTFPVPSDAVLYRLEAVVGGRRVRGVAQAKGQAEKTYEEALGEGLTAVRHEELLPGLHLLSAGNIGPGSEIEVSGTWTAPLQLQEGVGRLRIPMTVGQVYGESGLEDVDEPRAGARPGTARLVVRCGGGAVRLGDATLIPGPGAGAYDGFTPTDAPVELTVSDWEAVLEGGVSEGLAADGREVSVRVAAAGAGDGPAHAVVLVDRSASMADLCAGDGGETLNKWDAARRGLGGMAARLRVEDGMELWEFDNEAGPVGPGDAGSRGFARAIRRLGEPRGGTEIGGALDRVCREAEAPDILLVTDGKSHSLDAGKFLRGGRRLFVVLVGEDSLDGELARMAITSGGQVFLAGGRDIGRALLSALGALRTPRAPRDRVETVEAEEGLAPLRAEAVRGGARVTAEWSEKADPLFADEIDHAIDRESDGVSSAVPALAAGIALGGLPDESAERLALAEGIVSPWTSLVLVDEAGGQVAEPAIQRRAALPDPRTTVTAKHRAFEPEAMRVSLPPTPRFALLSPNEPRAPGAGFAPPAPATPRRTDAAPWPSEWSPRSASAPDAAGPQARLPDRPAAERRLREAAFFGTMTEEVRRPNGQTVPGRKLIVDSETDTVLADVSSGYRMVRNEEACDLGKRIFGLVFGGDAARELRPFNLTMPKTRSFMHADFTAESLRFALGDGDGWLPFLRVTNSYNRTHQVGFRIGVCRWICMNGLIFEEKSVVVKDKHSGALERWYERARRDPEKIGLERFDLEAHRLRLERLAEVAVPEAEFLAGLADGLGMTPAENLDALRSPNGRQRPSPHTVARWSAIGRQLRELERRYRDSHGSTAFALVNAASEYASRTGTPGMDASRLNALQRRCGELAERWGEPGATFEVGDDALAAARRIEIAIEHGE